MNRKHNPMVSLAALLLLVVILVMACTGCDVEAYSSGSNAEAELATTGRFDVEFESWSTCSRTSIFTITDNQTGVRYLYCMSANSAGLTVLQD